MKNLLIGTEGVSKAKRVREEGRGSTGHMIAKGRSTQKDTEAQTTKEKVPVQYFALHTVKY